MQGSLEDQGTSGFPSPSIPPSSVLRLFSYGFFTPEAETIRLHAYTSLGIFIPLSTLEGVPPRLCLSLIPYTSRPRAYFVPCLGTRLDLLPIFSRAVHFGMPTNNRLRNGKIEFDAWKNKDYLLRSDNISITGARFDTKLGPSVVHGSFARYGFPDASQTKTSTSKLHDEYCRHGPSGSAASKWILSFGSVLNAH